MLFTIVTRVAVVTVQLVVAHTHICSHKSIAQLYTAYTALEAVNVVEQPQTLNDHGCSPSCTHKLLDLM